MADLKDILFGEGPLLKLINNENVPKGPLHPQYFAQKELPKEEGFSLLNFNPKELIASSWDYIKQSTIDGLNQMRNGWFDFVGWLYEKTTMLFFHTPIELLDNPKVMQLTSMFLELAVWGVGVLVIVEGIRIIFNGKARNIGEILVKSVVGTIGAVVAPHIMIWGVWLVNKISAMIVLKSQSFAGDMNYSDVFSHAIGDGAWETLGTVLFVVAYLYCLTKLLLVVAKRLFDLVVATAISPLAFCSYIFETTEKYFKMWGSHTMGLYLFQLAYTVYFTIFSAFIIIPLPQDWDTVWVRMFMIIGALFGISHPPKWITGLAGGKEFSPIDTYKKYRKWKTGGTQ